MKKLIKNKDFSQLKNVFETKQTNLKLKIKIRN